MGATGAVGNEVVAVLDKAPWRPEKVVAIAQASTSTPFVDYGDQQLPVEDLRHVSWSDMDGVIVAVPRDDAGEIVEHIADEGIPLIDCSGSQLTNLEVPLVVPWLDASVLDAPRPRDVVAVPSAAGALLGSVLRSLGSVTASATVMLPASSWGRDGVEELSKQVIALFNQGVAPRKVFGDGLAFDLLPQVGTRTASGWSSTEVRIATEVARIAGVRCDVSLVAVPLFTGVSATIRIDGEGLEAEFVEQKLVAGGLDLVDGASARSLPRPRRMDGVAIPQVARVRAGMDGRSVHLWTSVDNLHATATASVAALAALLSHGDDA